MKNIFFTSITLSLLFFCILWQTSVAAELNVSNVSNITKDQGTTLKSLVNNVIEINKKIKDDAKALTKANSKKKKSDINKKIEKEKKDLNDKRKTATLIIIDIWLNIIKDMNKKISATSPQTISLNDVLEKNKQVANFLLTAQDSIQSELNPDRVLTRLREIKDLFKDYQSTLERMINDRLKERLATWFDDATKYLQYLSTEIDNKKNNRQDIGVAEGKFYAAQALMDSLQKTRRDNPQQTVIDFERLFILLNEASNAM